MHAAPKLRGTAQTTVLSCSDGGKLEGKSTQPPVLHLHLNVTCFAAATNHQNCSRPAAIALNQLLLAIWLVACGHASRGVRKGLGLRGAGLNGRSPGLTSDVGTRMTLFSGGGCCQDTPRRADVCNRGRATWYPRRFASNMSSSDPICSASSCSSFAKASNNDLLFLIW